MKTPKLHWMRGGRFYRSAPGWGLQVREVAKGWPLCSSGPKAQPAEVAKDVDCKLCKTAMRAWARVGGY